jgi:molybdate transport system regulatory protein
MNKRGLAYDDALGRAISDRRIEVLRGIALTGSISSAARALGISYKAAWQAVETLSGLASAPLVERTVGGSGGGGARLTRQGEQLLVLAEELALARRAVLARHAAGEALSGGLGLRTSMRNQIACEVESCEPLAVHDPMVLVRLRTAGGDLLLSQITQESADLLGVAPGMRIHALCKAAAVEVMVADAPGVAAAAPGDAAPVFFLGGRIRRVSPGERRDEVTLELEGGGLWAGFAPHPFPAAEGEWAQARVSAAALVLALAG